MDFDFQSITLDNYGLNYYINYFNYLKIYMNDCSSSVVSQAFQSSIKPIGCAIFLNLLKLTLHKIKVNQKLFDVILCFVSIILALYLLHEVFQGDMWNVVLLIATKCIIICAIKPKPCQFGVISVCMLYIILNELYLDRKSWHAIRGPVMVLLMKGISLANHFDQGHLIGGVKVTSVISYLASPVTLLYGPWMDFLTFEKWLKIDSFSPKSLWTGTRHFLTALIFLLCSTCVSQLIFGQLLPADDSKWLSAYQNAQSFRMSHYFVCFLSLSFLSFADMDVCSELTGSHRSIVHPSHMELPRSLINVVTLWNLPMHYWLKTYVFQSCRHLGRFGAILVTFATSSLLHGFNFSLSAILISLGVFSYVEYVTRGHLSKMFNCCIRARVCPSKCDHRFKARHPVSLVLNMFFSTVAVLQLAYIAAMFDGSDTQDQGYSMQHTLAVWRNLGYAGHWLVAAMYATYLLVKRFS